VDTFCNGYFEVYLSFELNNVLLKIIEELVYLPLCVFCVTGSNSDMKVLRVLLVCVFCVTGGSNSDMKVLRVLLVCIGSCLIAIPR
jgi:hypothetical protein